MKFNFKILLIKFNLGGMVILEVPMEDTLNHVAQSLPSDANLTLICSAPKRQTHVLDQSNRSIGMVNNQ